MVLIRGALGDVMLSLPMLAALPFRFRAESLTLVGNPTVLRLLANQPFVAEIRDLNQADWAGLWLDPPEVPKRLARFVLSHRSGVVLTRRPDDPAVTGLKRLGLDPVLAVPSRPPEGQKIHLTDHMFASLGIRPTGGRITILPTDQDLAQSRSLLLDLGLDKRPWLALQPGSGAAEKNWPVENWLALAGAIRKDLGLAPVFLLGPAEERLAERIFQGTAESGAHVVRNPDLGVAAGLLCLGRGFAGHDSGMTHLAACLGCPTLAVFGPTDPAFWAPRGPKVVILAPPQGAQPERPWDWLDLSMVLGALKTLLARGRKKAPAKPGP